MRAPRIVGRGPALDAIDRALADPAEGVLAIVGDPGLGKTRLAGEAAARARRAGRLALEGRATRHEGAVSLAVFRDALRADRRERPGAAPPDDPLAAAFPERLLPELGREGGQAPAGHDRGVLFEAAARWLRSLAAPPGVLLVLEDLHLADATSLALAHHLARTSVGLPRTLVLTWRPHDAASGAALARLREDLRRDRLGAEIPLEPVDRLAVAELVSGLLGRAPDPRAVSAVADAAGGNPFAVEELVRSAVASGRLDPESGAWSGAGPLGLPGAVQELLLVRIRALRPADRDLVRWAAVAGARFDLDLVAAAAGREGAAALHAVARLHAAGLVVDDRAGGLGRLAFRHAITREAVLSELLGPERRSRHARLLEVAEARAAESGHAPLADLIAHAVAVEDRARAVRYSLEAARRSLDLGGDDEARDHYERVLALWTPALGPEPRAAALLGLGRLAERSGGDPAAGELLSAAARAYDSAGDPAGAAAARAASAEARFDRGEAAEAVDEARALVRELDDDAPAEARLVAHQTLARLLSMSGAIDEAASAAGEALALVADRPGRAASITRVRMLNVLGGTEWLRGHVDAGREAMLESARLAAEVSDPVGVARAYTNLALCAARYGMGPLAPAAAWAEAGAAVAAESGLRPAEAWLAALRAAVHLEGGEAWAAEPLMARAGELLAEVGAVPHIRLSLAAARAEAHLASADLAVAVESYGAALRAARDLHHPGSSWLVRDGLARTLLAAGDAPGAVEALAPALAEFGAAPALTASCAWLASTGAEAALAAGRRLEAEALAGLLTVRVPGPLANATAALVGARPGAGALVEDAAARVEALGRRWRSARMRLGSAEALAAAGCAEDAALLARAAAQAFRRLGYDGWRRRAEGLLRRLGHAVPSRGSGRGEGPLTRREQEVLRLLADGLTNAQVAARLVLSPATVARHVANVYAKLGVRNRAEAARVATERGLLRPPPPAVGDPRGPP